MTTHFFWDGLRDGWHEVFTGDPFLAHLLRITMQVAGVSTGIALVLGLPIGLWLGLGRAKGLIVFRVLANLGFIMPPVVVGIVLSTLMFPQAPLGRFHLLYTLRGVYVAQTVLALPIVVALTSAAVHTVPVALLDQARALSARRWRIWVLALREARGGIVVAAIAAIGSGLSEVGAVVLVGGNIFGHDQTLASAALQTVNEGQIANSLGISIILIGIMLIITAVLTVIQYRDEAVLSFRRAL